MPNWARFGGLILGLAIVLAPMATGAAESPVLTLPQLISLALKFSPEVKASKSEVKLAEEQRNEAHGYRYPQLDAVGTGGLVPNAQRPEVRGGNIFYPDPANKIHGINVFGRLDFTVVQPLYTFGKIAFREEAAAKNIRVKEAGVEGKKGEVILQVAQAYYGLVLAEQGKDAVKEARTYLSDTRERITRLLAINSPNVRQTDSYRLAVYEGAVEKFGAEAEEGAKVAYQALKALIGYGPGQDFRVPPELPNPSQTPSSLDYYIRQALDLRPEFTQLKEGLVAKQLLVDAAKADQYPSLFFAVIGALAGAPGRQTTRDPYVYVVDYFNQTGALPMVGLKWHLDFGITKAKIGQARAELEHLQYTQKTALMGIPVEVAQEYGKVQEYYKGSVGLEKSYINARRWLITAFSNFDMGLGKLEDIFQAFEKYGAYRGDYLMALYSYNLSVAKLDKATGGFRRSLPAEAPLVGKAK